MSLIGALQPVALVACCIGAASVVCLSNCLAAACFSNGPLPPSCYIMEDKFTYPGPQQHSCIRHTSPQRAFACI